MGPPLPQEPERDTLEAALLRAARRSRVRAQARVARPDAKPTRKRPKEVSLSRLRCPSRDGEESLLLAIRQHREVEQPPSPVLARQRSGGPSFGGPSFGGPSSSGRVLARIASSNTNAATVGSERPSTRIALRGAKRAKGNASGGRSGAAGRSRPIPRMPYFGHVAARPGGAGRDCAASGERGVTSKPSNTAVVSLGRSTRPNEKRRESSTSTTPLQRAPDASTWQDLVETVGATVFDSASTANPDANMADVLLQAMSSPRPSQPKIAPALVAAAAAAAAVAAAGAATGGSQRSKDPAGKDGPKASEMIAASARNFVAGSPACRHAALADEKVRPTTDDLPLFNAALSSVPEALDAEPDGADSARCMREEAARCDSAVRAVVANLSAVTAAVIAGRTETQEVTERKAEGESKLPEPEREAEREEGKLLVSAQEHGLVPSPEGAGVGEGDFSMSAAEPETVKIVAVGGKPLLAPTEGNAGWEGVSVKTVAEHLKHVQQQIASESDEPNSAPLARTHLIAATEGSGNPQQHPPDSAPTCLTSPSSAQKPLDTAGRPGEGHGRRDSDVRVPTHRDRASLISQTSINSLVRDAMELADAIEQGWTGDHGEQWRWQPGQEHEDLTQDQGAGEGDDSVPSEELTQEREGEQLPTAESRPAGAGADIGADALATGQSAATAEADADVLGGAGGSHLSVPADCQNSTSAAELAAEETATARLVYQHQQHLRKEQRRQQERRRESEQQEYERWKQHRQHQPRQDDEATGPNAAGHAASLPGPSVSPAPPPAPLSSSAGQQSPPAHEDGVPWCQTFPAATDAVAASSAFNALPDVLAGVGTAATSPSPEHQTKSVMTVTASSPNFEPSSSGPSVAPGAHRATQSGPAGNSAAPLVMDTRRLRVTASGWNSPPQGVEHTEKGDRETELTCARPDAGVGDGPPSFLIPSRESHLKPGFRLVASSNANAAVSSPGPMMTTNMTPSSDLGLVRCLTSLTSPCSSLSASGLPSSEVTPAVAAAAAAAAAAASCDSPLSQMSSAATTPTPKSVEPRVSSGYSDGCPHQSSRAPSFPAAVMPSSPGAAVEIPAAPTLRKTTTSVTTSFRSSRSRSGSSSSSSSSSSTLGVVETSHGMNDSLAWNRCSRSRSGGAGGGGGGGGRSPSRVKDKGRIADHRSRHRRDQGQQDDGGGCFRFPVLHGDRGGDVVDHPEHTGSSGAVDKVWFSRSSSSSSFLKKTVNSTVGTPFELLLASVSGGVCRVPFSKLTRRSPTSSSTIGSSYRDGGRGDGGGYRASPRSRPWEAALEAVARKFGPGGGGRGNGGLVGNTSGVALRCAGSGADLSSRIRDFLGSERKVFLLIGEAGSGKSQCVASLVHELERSCSQRKGEGEEVRVADGSATDARAGGAGKEGRAAGRTRGFLPVLFDARAAEGEHGVPLDGIVEHYLTTRLGLGEKEVSNVQGQQRVLVIVDGFDKLPADKRRNLWTSNGWARWKMKAMFTSRPCGLAGMAPELLSTSHTAPDAAATPANHHREREGWFVPTDRRGLERWWALEAATIAPLAPDQVESFLRETGGQHITGSSSSSSSSNSGSGSGTASARGLAALHAIGSHPLTLNLACQLAAGSDTDVANATVASPAAAWTIDHPDRITRTWVMSRWLETALKRTDRVGGSSAAAARRGAGGIVGMGQREGDAAAGRSSIFAASGVGDGEAGEGGRFSFSGVRAAEDAAFSLFQAGQWTGGAAPSEMHHHHHHHHPAHASHRQLQRLVAPKECGNNLRGFSKSSLLEFLVASRVRRGVLEEGERRRRTGVNGGGGDGGRGNEQQRREMEEKGETEQLAGIDALPGPISVLAELNIGSNATASDGGGGRSVPHPGADLVLSFLGEMCSTDPVFADLLLQVVDDSRQQQRSSGSLNDESSSSDKKSGEIIDTGSGSVSTPVGGGGGGGGGGDGYKDAAVRNEARVVAASATAMTILCRSEHSFAGTDLSRIKIPGAVLDGGVFDGCSFYGADLTGCSLKNASLRRCNLRGARMRGIDLGALPVLRPFGGSRASARAEAGVALADGGSQREEMIGRVEVSADATVVAVLSSDGRCGKLLRTGYLEEVCKLSPGTGRVFSMDSLLLSPDGRLILAYTTFASGCGGKDDRYHGSKRLELRRVVQAAGDHGNERGGQGDQDQDGELCARVVFQERCMPDSAQPCFFPDASRFIYQQGENEVTVVDCASGEPVDVITVNLVSLRPDHLDQQRRRRQQDAQDKNLECREDSSSLGPSICSLRVTPDQSKVQVGLSSDVLLEYGLGAEGLRSKGCPRVGYGALKGRRVIDARTHNGQRGLYAVLGPDRAIQIRSWRVKPSTLPSRNTGGTTGNEGGKGVLLDRELARLRCGDDERIEEAAFASSGDFFLTRDPVSGTACLWSVKPRVTLVQRIKHVCCRMASELFVDSGKAVALAHSECTVKVYSCETGKVILSHSVPSPAISVTMTAALDTHGHLTEPLRSSGGGDGTRYASSTSAIILHAFTQSGQIYRWRLAPQVSIAAELAREGRDLFGDPVDADRSSSGACPSSGCAAAAGGGGGGMARAVAALPAPSSAVSGISGGGGGGGSSTGRQQLVLVMAGERGLVVVDAARGVLVQELSGARGGGRESSGHDGSRCGGGGRGVSHLAVTPDGEAFFSVGDDNALVEWDASTFATRSSRPLDSEVRSLAVSQDSKLVAVLTFEGVAVHDVGFASGDGGDPPLSGRSGCGGTELPAGPESSSPHAASRFGRRDDPVQLAFWDDRTLAVAHSRGCIQLWDVAMYRKRRTNETALPASPSSSPSSSFVTAEWGAHDGPVTCIAARPAAVRQPSPRTGGSLGGEGGKDRTRSADVAVGTNALTRLAMPRSPPPAVATGGGDGMVRVWTNAGRGTGVAAVAAAGTRHHQWRGSSDIKQKSSSPETSATMSAADVRIGHEGAVLCVCWHPGGEVLASAGQDWAIWLWNAEGRALSYVHAPRRWVQALCFSESGEFLTSSCSVGGGFAGWAVDVSEGRQVFKIRWRHPKKLVATHAEFDDAIGLSDDNAQALRDHGAAAPPPLPPPSPPSTNPHTNTGTAATTTAGTHGGSNLEKPSDVATPMSVVCIPVHARVEDADWTIDGVRSLVWPTGNYELDARDSEGMTVLLRAARHGRGRLAEALLSAGADAGASDNRGYTAVCWAAAGGYSTILRLLLSSRDEKEKEKSLQEAARAADRTTMEGDTPAILAARGGHLCAVAVLEESGADLRRSNHKGETPLIVASREGRTEVVAFLAGPVVGSGGLERRDVVDGTSALAAAASHGRTACVGVLLARGVDPSAPTADGRSPTFFAAAGGHLAALRLLLDEAADWRVEATLRPDSAGRTPVMAASANGHLRCLRALIDGGGGGGGGGGGYVGGGGGGGAAQEAAATRAAIERRDKDGRTALMHACVFGQAECVKYLLSIGARIDVSDHCGITPIMRAAGGGHESCLSTLLDAATTTTTAVDSAPPSPFFPDTRKANLLDAADTNGSNASHYACRAGQGGALSLLADAGARLETPSGRALANDDAANDDAAGEGMCVGSGMNVRPVHLAIVCDSLSCLEVLAARGVNLEITDGDGETPLSLAVKHGSEECGKLLTRAAGATTTAAPTSSPAGTCGTTAKPRVDLDRPAGPMQERPLNLAARRGRPAFVSLLLAAGADPLATGRDGETAVHAAARSGQAKIIEALAQAGDVDRGSGGGGTVSDVGGGGILPPWWFATTGMGETATFAAAVEGHARVLRVLRAIGALEPSRPNAVGVTPVVAAAVAGHSEVIRVLLEGGDGGDAAHSEIAAGLVLDPGPKGLTAVHHAAAAAAEGTVDCLKIMAEAACAKNEPALDRLVTGSDGNVAAAPGGVGGNTVGPVGLTVSQSDHAGRITCGAEVGGDRVPSSPVTSCGGVERKGRLRHPFEGCLDEDGESPLHVAARAGHLRVFAYLMDEVGLRPEGTNARGENCLWLAAANERVDILRLLMKEGYDVNTTDHEGRCPAHAAARENQVGALAVLAENARRCPPASGGSSSGGGGGGDGGGDGGTGRSIVDFDARDLGGASPLHHAVEGRHAEAAAFLCDAGANVDAVDALGNTPCWQAVVDGQAGMLELLASKGADLNMHTSTGTTLTHLAARDCNYSCLEVLCERGADVDVVNQLGNTPIMFAAMGGDLKSVNLLAYLSCDLSKRDSQMVTPAFFSAQNGHSECLSLLLSLGADATVRRADGATPLIIAAQNGHDSCVKALLNPPPVRLLLPSKASKKQSLYGDDSSGRRDSSSNSNSSSGGDGGPRSPVVQQPRAGLETRTSSGYTALSLAAAAGRGPCVRELLSVGADVHAADRKGRSPLYLAAAVGSAEICGLLLERGALPRQRAADESEPAMVAACRGHALAARRILEDAPVGAAEVLDAAGVSISTYLSGLDHGAPAGSPFGAGGRGRGRGGDGKGCRHIAPLLPASVARLTPAAKRCKRIGSAAVKAGCRGTISGGGGGSSSGSPTTGSSGSSSRNNPGTRKQGTVPFVGASGASAGAAGSTFPPFHPGLNGRNTEGNASPLAASAAASECSPALRSSIHGGGERRRPSPGLPTLQRRRSESEATERVGNNNKAVATPAKQRHQQRQQARPAEGKPLRRNSEGEGGGGTLLSRMAAFLFDTTVTEQTTKRRPSSSSIEALAAQRVAAQRKGAVAFARGASRGKSSVE